MSDPTYDPSPGALEAAKELIGDQSILTAANYTSEYLTRKAAIIDRCVSHELALEMDARLELVEILRGGFVFHKSEKDSRVWNDKACAALAKHQENE